MKPMMTPHRWQKTKYNNKNWLHVVNDMTQNNNTINNIEYIISSWSCVSGEPCTRPDISDVTTLSAACLRAYRTCLLLLANNGGGGTRAETTNCALSGSRHAHQSRRSRPAAPLIVRRIKSVRSSPTASQTLLNSRRDDTLKT